MSRLPVAPGMFVDPRAPEPLVEHTLAVRAALVESPYGTTAGCCIVASLALGLRLRAGGYEAALAPCNVSMLTEHMHVWSGRWGLDPTGDQFGNDVLVFEAGSPNDLYRPAEDRSVELSESSFLAELAWFGRRDLSSPVSSESARTVIEPLLLVAGVDSRLCEIEAAYRS